VIQHEVDHLFGKLFVDRIENMADLAFEEEWAEFKAGEAQVCFSGQVNFYD